MLSLPSPSMVTECFWSWCTLSSLSGKFFPISFHEQLSTPKSLERSSSTILTKAHSVLGILCHAVWALSLGLRAQFATTYLCVFHMSSLKTMARPVLFTTAFQG